MVYNLNIHMELIPKSVQERVQEDYEWGTGIAAGHRRLRDAGEIAWPLPVIYLSELSARVARPVKLAAFSLGHHIKSLRGEDPGRRILH